jgi:ATP-dependent DNA ligase
MRLSRRAHPFDSNEFIYELKIDGFRALAHLHGGQGELVSRNGNVFRGFGDLAQWLADHIFADQNGISPFRICGMAGIFETIR